MPFVQISRLPAVEDEGNLVALTFAAAPDSALKATIEGQLGQVTSVHRWKVVLYAGDPVGMGADRPAPGAPLLEVTGSDLRVAYRARRGPASVANPWLVPTEDIPFSLGADKRPPVRVDVWLRIPNALLEFKLTPAGWTQPKEEGDYAWLSLGVVNWDGELRVNHLGLSAGAAAHELLGGSTQGWWIYGTAGSAPRPFDGLQKLQSENQYAALPPYLAAGVPRTPRTLLTSAVERLLGASATDDEPTAEGRTAPPRVRKPRPLYAQWKAAPGQPWRLVLRRAFLTDPAAPDGYFRAPAGEREPLLLTETEADGAWELTAKLDVPAAEPRYSAPFQRAWRTWLSPWTGGAALRQTGLFELCPATSTSGYEIRYRLGLGEAGGRMLVALTEANPAGFAAGRHQARLIFPCIRDYAGRSLEVTGEFDAGGAPEVSVPASPAKGRKAGWKATLDLTFSALVVPEACDARLGAVDVRFGGKIPPKAGETEAPAGRCHFVTEVETAAPGAVSRLVFAEYALGEKSAQAVRLPLLELRPGSTQPARNSDDDGALLFQIHPEPTDPKEPARKNALQDTYAAASLELTESASHTRDRVAKLSIKRVSSADIPGIQTMLYLSGKPFFVALLRSKRIETSASSSGNDEFAYWSSDSLASDWQWKASSDGFTLVLPPQGMGEAMEKASPKSKDALYRNDQAVEDIAEGEPVAVRFPPATVLTLAGNDLPRQYGATPWDIPRRLDGLRDQRLAGQPLKSADFEMLYGLRFTLSGMPYLRLAELFSRLGIWCDQLPDPAALGAALATVAFKRRAGAFRDEWDRMRRLLASRLAVYEVFDDRQSDFGAQGEPVGWQLSRSDAPGAELTARLRRTARLKTSFGRQFPGIPNFDEGLAGSFAWAFESPVLYEALWKTPALHPEQKGETDPQGFVTAVSASLTRLYFSALGGWGTQSASFDNGRAIITATVEMGRVSELIVERIGRIGVFWNKAKLVTVFRRTTLPTAQFATQQDLHYGRPLLRKVEEYVEFIEKSRAFPDRTSADARLDCGCVAGLSCTERIPVDSRWGQDVYDSAQNAVGWSLPLYQPGVNESVYGRGNVLLQLLANPDSGRETFDTRVASMERLRFWTDVTVGTDATTDNWNPIVRVDFPWRIKLSRPDDTLEKSTGFGVPPLEEENAMFTLRLESTEEKANLVGHLGQRKADGRQVHLGSTLRYLTVHREQPRDFVTPPATNPTLAVDARECRLAAEAETALAIFSQLEAALPLKQVPKEDADLVLAALDQESLKNVTAAIAALGTPLNPAVICERVKKNIEWTLAQAERQYLGLGARLRALLNSLPGSTAAGENAIKDAVVEAAKSIDGSTAQLLKFAGQAQDALNQLAANATPISGQIEQAKTSLADLLTRVNTLTEAQLPTLQTALETGLAKIGDLVTEVDRVIQDVDLAVGRLAHHGWWRDVPHTIDVTPLVALLAKARESLGAVRDAEARLLAQVRVLAGKGTAELDAAKKEWTAALGSLQRSLDKAGVSWSGEINSAIAQARTRVTAAAALITSLLPAGANEELRELEKALLAAYKAGAVKWEDFQKEIETTVQKVFPWDPAQLARKRQAIAATLGAHACALLNTAGFLDLSGLAGEAIAALDRLKGRWKAAVIAAGATEESVRREVQQAVAQGRRELERAGRRALEGIRHQIQIPPPLKGAAALTLKLPHAWGTVPAVPGLDFSGMSALAAKLPAGDLGRALEQKFKSVKYRFDRELGVAMTPVKSFIDEAEQAVAGAQRELKLKAAAVRQEVCRLRDRVEADAKAMATQLLGDVLPDFAGLNLEHLLGPIPVGDELARQFKERVRVTHDFHAASGTGFVDAVVDNLTINEPIVIFSFGPVSLSLEKISLNAHTRIARLPGGQVQKTETAKLEGNWVFTGGGNRLLTYENAALTMNNGRFNMELDPSKMRLTGVLDSIASAMKKFAPGGDTGIPGVQFVPPNRLVSQYSLDLKMPNLDFGIFAFSQLSLGANFSLELVLNPLALKESSFLVSAGLNLARQNAPFIFTMSAMGGCGWFAMEVGYRVFFGGQPSKPTSRIDIGFGAAATLGFDVGWACGSVYMAFNLRILIVHGYADGNGTNFELGLSLVGRLCLLGYIDAFIAIHLSITYSSDGGMVGRGSISVRIKICWCFTFKLNRSFEKRLKGGSSGGGGDAFLDTPARKTLYTLEASPGAAFPATAPEPAPPRRRPAVARIIPGLV
jgi:hypothetical protein